MAAMTVDTRTGEITDPLNETESARLRVKENVIERGAQQIGEALAAIRNERLYRTTHSTFDTYCQERWGITPQHANRQIAAAEVVAALEPNGSIPESQARELAPLRDDPDRMREIWDSVNEATGGKPTAAAIRAVRDPEPQTPAPRSTGEGVTGAGQSPEGVDSTPRPPVTGMDGKSYPRPEPRAPKPVMSADEADYDNAEQASKALARAVGKLLEFQYPNMRDHQRRYWSMASIEVPPTSRRDVTPEQMRLAAQGLLNLADEWDA
jgi:hypothetical protein